MLENIVESPTAKLQSLNQQSMSAKIEINVGKTKTMHIMKKEQVTVTTTQDVKEMNFQHPCPNCGREFPTAHGMKIHLAQWRTGDPEERSRKGTLADTKVKRVKHSKAAKARKNVIFEFSTYGECGLF